MNLDLPQFLFGLVLLWFPRPWMRLGISVGRRRKGSGRKHHEEVEPWLRRESGDPRIDPRREARKVRNYFDLLRGLAGSIAILGGPFVVASLTAAEGASKVVAREVLALNLAILFVGLLIQTMRFERGRMTFFAPIFYLAGVSASLCSGWGALFAFLLIWGMNPMLGSAQGFLTVYGVLLCIFGLLFRGLTDKMPIAALGLCLLPVLLSLLARKPLVVFSRKAARPTGG
jgi:hypothetical protein